MEKKFKFDPNSDIEINLDRFNNLSQDLTNSGEILSHDQQSVALLSSLPNKYKELKKPLNMEEFLLLLISLSLP